MKTYTSREKAIYKKWIYSQKHTNYYQEDKTTMTGIKMNQ